MADVYLVITIDTECDHSYDWTKSDPLTFMSVTESIPNVLEPVFRKYGAIGTYLLTAEVLEDDACVHLLRNIGNCELGGHLHPEYMAPEKKHKEYAGTYSKEFSNNYPPDIEKQKIANLTNLFEKKIGYRPLVYRGGKFAFSANTGYALMELGYSVDTSVTPKISWQKIGGPDFAKFPDQPYIIKGNGQASLLEVPVSIVYLNSLWKFLNRPTWLRPTYSETADIKKLIDVVIKKYAGQKIIVLNMMFHSMELYLGASPYSTTKEKCEKIIGNIEMTLQYCKRIGVNFCKLSDLKTHLERAGK